MKLIICVLASIAFVTADFTCERQKPEVPQVWLDMVDPCIQKVRGQVQEELKASIQYLAMAAYFSRDSVNRMGFAKMFYEAASEEREHAIKLIEYLLMRGELVSNVSSLIKPKIFPTTTEWNSGVHALKDALKLEASVTEKIRDVIITCEEPKNVNPANPSKNNYNDYHFVDYLTGVFLEEQYKGQREIAGKIATLDKFMAKHGPLGEFLYDKQLSA